jgi:hypothetical protein
MGVFAVLYMASRAVGTGMLQVGTEAERTEQGSGRAKVSPRPWEWEQSHEIGCCYPVGESHMVQIPPD